MEEFFSYVLLAIILILSVLWLYGMFIIFVNRDSPKEGFWWSWTAKYDVKWWLPTCLICNFFVGCVLFISYIITRKPSTYSTLETLFFDYYIPLLFIISHILSYYGIKFFIHKIMKKSDEKQLKEWMK